MDDERHIPKHPTNGWMIVELERLGVRVRGTKTASNGKLLARLLNDRGYSVSATPVPGPKKSDPAGGDR